MTPTPDNTAESFFEQIRQNDNDKHFPSITYEEDSSGGSNSYYRSDLVFKAMEEYRSIGERAKDEEIRLMEITLSHKKTLLESCEKALGQRDEEIKKMKEENEKLTNIISDALSVSEGELKAKEERPDWSTVPDSEGNIHIPDHLDKLTNYVATQIRFHTISGLSEAETIAHIVHKAEKFFSSEVNTQKEWISLKERLPDYGVKVLICFKGEISGELIMKIDYLTQYHNNDPEWNSTTGNNKVLFWMPLPDVSNLNK